MESKDWLIIGLVVFYIETIIIAGIYVSDCKSEYQDNLAHCEKSCLNEIDYLSVNNYLCEVDLSNCGNSLNECLSKLNFVEDELVSCDEDIEDFKDSYNVCIEAFNMQRAEYCARFDVVDRLELCEAGLKKCREYCLG